MCPFQTEEKEKGQGQGVEASAARVHTILTMPFIFCDEV